MLSLIPLEKYRIFETDLVIHYRDPHLEDDVNILIKTQNLTVDNYRDFRSYDRELSQLAHDFHETNEGYLNNSFNLTFASIFQNPDNSDAVLAQIGRLDNKSLEEVKSLKYKEKTKKSGTMMIKEMILAIIETKLTQD